MVTIPTRVRVVVVGSLLALAAGLLTLALLTKPAQAQAESETTVTRDQIVLRFPDPCHPGEEVFFEGTLQVLFHETVDANGVVHVQGQSLFQGQGVSTSGNKYVRIEAVNAHNTFTADGSGDDFTFTYTQRFIRLGPDTGEDDFQSKLLIHVTRNANGEVTAEVEVVDVQCR